RVSRNHCEILVEGDQVTVVDNDSQGGTQVNGTPIKRRLLRLGDVVQVGDTQLRLQVGDLPLDAVQELAKQAAVPSSSPGPPTPGKPKDLSGKTLSHYDIGPVIGEGTSAIVFHATDTRDNRPVALKVLQPEFTRNDKDVQRFIRGMKTALPLRH